MSYKHLMITLSLTGLVLTAAPVVAGDVLIQGLAGAFKVPAKSTAEMRWDKVVRQRYDFSCGSAAVASLLNHHYNTPTTEEQVFEKMFAIGEQEKIKKVGFSMFDMKRYLDSVGLRADGFKMSLEKFARIGVPGITMVTTNGYRHFVVVKGVEGDRVLVGDPALGTRVIPRQEFEQMWNGAVLAGRERTQIARSHFNEEQDWRVRPRAPVGQGMDRQGVGAFTLNLPNLNEFISR